METEKNILTSWTLLLKHIEQVGGSITLLILTYKYHYTMSTESFTPTEHLLHMSIMLNGVTTIFAKKANTLISFALLSTTVMMLMAGTLGLTLVEQLQTQIVWWCWILTCGCATASLFNQGLFLNNSLLQLQRDIEADCEIRNALLRWHLPLELVKRIVTAWHYFPSDVIQKELLNMDPTATEDDRLIAIHRALKPFDEFAVGQQSRNTVF